MGTRLEDYQEHARDANCTKCWFKAHCKIRPNMTVLVNTKKLHGEDAAIELQSSIAKSCTKYCYGLEMDLQKERALKSEDACWYGKEPK